MARLSDIIEEVIKEMIREADGIVELQRNELASRFNCVPSQINYVIGTRFNPENGYYVESRRGGGGYIKIKRINIDKSDYIMHMISSMGDEISPRVAEAFILNLYDYNVINEREATMIKAAVSDKALPIQQEARDYVRAKVLKNILISIV